MRRSLHPHTITKHHRKPKARGGKSGKSHWNNISLVPWDLHQAYHSIFGVLLPAEVVSILNIIDKRKQWVYIAKMKRGVVRATRKRKQRVQEGTHEAFNLRVRSSLESLEDGGSGAEIRQAAWNILFDTLSSPEIARILSETWIDPDWTITTVHI